MPAGFILEPTYRFEAGRPVIHLWGVLEGGASFLVRDRRVEPYFFIRTGDLARARDVTALATRDEALRTMSGDPVVRLVFATPADLAAARDRLEAAAVATYESDLRFVQRYLIDRRIRGGILVTGAPAATRGGTTVFDDPAVAPADFAPELRVLSLDIETDPTASRILSVALHGSGVATVVVVRGGRGALPPFATEVADERTLLVTLAERVRAFDPDVLSGWNLIGFDLVVLERRARELGLPLQLGRGPGPLRVRIDRSFRGTSRAEVEGRAVLDGIDLLRGAFVKVGDLRLDTVARELLGEGKAIATHGPDKAREIERRWREDLASFCAYNLKDAELVSRILEKTGVVRLAVRRSLLTGLPLDRVSASIASFDALYLPELRRRGFVAGAVRAARDGGGASTAGGAVLTPEPGLHQRVAVLDFKSLYPSLMRTFNIDPLTYRASPTAGEDAITTPAGARFARDPSILGAILTRLLEVREAAKRSGDGIASQATKILMNSFYGVLATSACRFHSPAIANAITGTGQALLYWTKRRVEERGYRVLYGDTDSLFVATAAATDAAAREAAIALVPALNDDLARHLAAAHGVDSRMEIELDGVFLKLFLPHIRHGEEGARKRYAGVVEEDGRREVVFVGMETVRRDWTAAAKEFQRGLYERMFAAAPVEAFVREFVRSLRAGERDRQLVYTKALRKPAGAYTATTPPHVRAARLSPGSGRIVEYVITTAGPEPAGEQKTAIDHEHYIDKQLRPIALAVLPALGLDWDTVAGNPRQLPLFG